MGRIIIITTDPQSERVGIPTRILLTPSLQLMYSVLRVRVATKRCHPTFDPPFSVASLGVMSELGVS